MAKKNVFKNLTLVSLSIRTQIVALVLFAVLPAIAIVLFLGLGHRSDLIEAAKADSLHLTQSIAFQEEGEVESIRQLLVTVSELPAVQNRDVAACNTLLSEILKSNPRNLNLGLATADGKIFASGIPVVPFSIDISKRKYFMDAIATRKFSVGEYAVGKVTGIASLHFAYPVLDNAGNLKALIYASIDRNNFNRLLSNLKLPKGSVLNLTDHKGTVIYRNLDPDKHTGKPDVPDMRNQVSGVKREGSFFGTGRDGVRRLYSFKQLRLTESDNPYMYIRVGIPEDRALEAAGRKMTQSLILTCVAALTALIIAWYLGNYFVAKRLKRLVATAEELGSGNLNARTGILYNEGEMGLLARTFDEMGAALELREMEHRQMEDALRKAKDETDEASRAKSELIEKLEASLAEVKRLSGLIPICSNCKKVRDDDGYWQQVEQYVSHHSDAKFSHGLCPGCLSKLYPDLADRVLKK